jgi:hypothetical protein
MLEAELDARNKPVGFALVPPYWPVVLPVFGLTKCADPLARQVTTKNVSSLAPSDSLSSSKTLHSGSGGILTLLAAASSVRRLALQIAAADCRLCFNAQQSASGTDAVWAGQWRRL